MLTVYSLQSAVEDTRSGDYWRLPSTNHPPAPPSFVGKGVGGFGSDSYSPFLFREGVGGFGFRHLFNRVGLREFYPARG
jgi:hypothetical protein